MSDPHYPDFGPHTRCVVELMHWIEQGQLFRFRGHVPSGSFHVVSDFQEALALAHRRGSGIAYWPSLRRNAETLLYKPGLLDTAAWLPYQPAIMDLLDLDTDSVVGTLPEQYDAAVDDVIADLHVCACCFAIHGQLDPFHQLLWMSYQSGGWPCGCTGSDPTPADYRLFNDAGQYALKMDARSLFVLWEPLP